MEESAFAAFYDATYGGLRAYVARGAGDPAAADDIAQEAYIRLLQAARKGTDIAATKAYLYRIATNLLIDHRRRRGREVRNESREPAATRREDARLDRNLDVGEAFGKLDPRQRMLLWLAHVEGYPHRDIARIMNVGERSVRVLLFRARKRFAEALRGKDIELEETP